MIWKRIQRRIKKMANPVTVLCTEGVYTKIATNVTSGIVHKLLTGPVYKQTYRLTGQAAPTLETEAALMFENSMSEEISADAAIDVYVWCIGAAGKVRVDL